MYNRMNYIVFPSGAALWKALAIIFYRCGANTDAWVAASYIHLCVSVPHIIKWGEKWGRQYCIVFKILKFLKILFHDNCAKIQLGKKSWRWILFIGRKKYAEHCAYICDVCYYLLVISNCNEDVTV